MMSIIIIALLVNLLIETSVSFTVVVPRDQIVARVGSTVTLPCWISPAENAEALEIRWYRHDQFSNPVLFYQYGKIQDLQEESYRNRSSLAPRSDQSGGLKNGDVSLRLEKLTVQDEGSFHCYVSGESAYDSSKVVLKVTDPPDSPDSSGPWKALFFTLLICNLLGLAGQILYKYRQKLTGKKTVKEVCDDETMESLTTEEKHKADVGAAPDASPSPNCLLVPVDEEATATGSIPQDSGQTRPSADVESSSLCGTASATHLQTADAHSPPPPQIVGDTNIEELRRHAVQITIDRGRLHAKLSVTDGKIVNNAPRYKPTGRGFPYELCVFGAQIFTSGRHYWEVSLAHEDLPAKVYWLIGVAKPECFLGKNRYAFTPSNGYWFLCSDGPNGFSTNSDPPDTLSLTPRPEQLGVLLDYDHGLLSFYSVKERKHLLTMSTRFSGSVVPLFNPGVGDQSPLVILDCPKPVESALESSDPLLSKSSV